MNDGEKNVITAEEVYGGDDPTQTERCITLVFRVGSW